ncbi:ABC transporter permease subunit [Solirubrobacter soli]|uniref:ABC transporter permease subunit n=1 Tax=Solirubrobacter soli TaxID=363832 RepID=UPI0004091A89|nr:ABC transporter permease subunit [Solirubrobacter soli]
MIAAEIFKLRTTRTFYGLVGASLGLVLVIVILVTALVNFSPSDKPLEDMLNVAGFVQPFALVLGILAVTSEFRHGTITPSLLVTPDRVKLTLAKLVATLLICLALGLVTVVLVVGIVKGIGSARDLDTSGDVGSKVIGATLAVGLWGALGVGLGALVRNQVGAIVGSLVYIFVLENLLQIIPKFGDQLAKYGLGGVSGALFGVDSDSGDMLGQVPGGLLFAGYVLVFLIAGIALMRERDITA